MLWLRLAVVLVSCRFFENMFSPHNLQLLYRNFTNKFFCSITFKNVQIFHQNSIFVARDCNPGLLFQSREFGIEKCQSRDPGIESRDWVPDFELVKFPLTVLFWSHDEFLNLDLSAGVLFWHIIMWIIGNIFTFLVSCRLIQFHHYLM